MYISGTHQNPYNTENDLRTWPNIATGTIWLTPRYKQAEQVYNIYKNQIDTIVSHSLGSSIAQELIKRRPQVKEVRAYGAPIIQGSNDKRIKYYSRNYDPTGYLTFKPERIKKRGYFYEPLKAHSTKGIDEGMVDYYNPYTDEYGGVGQAEP